MKKGSQARRKSLREFGYQKETPKRVFRRLRTARRLPQPPLRHLLKKVDENFYQTDEARSFCLQPEKSAEEAIPLPIFLRLRFLR